MSASECVVSQDTGEGNLGLKTDQSAERSVLVPISWSLKLDKELKLSHENFRQTVYVFFKDKDITPLSQLTATPPFPTPHVLAQFASKTYTDYKKRETDAQYETRLDLPDGWKLLTTASNSRKANGYFGAAYWHPEHQQVVIAHRGLVLKNWGALLTDVNGVLHNRYVPQMESAITFAHKAVEGLKAISRVKGVSFQIFYTGHSLGGWLAQITTFTTEYLKIEGNVFLKSNDVQECCHPHTVVFDSPGCKDMLSKMVDELDVRLDGHSIDIEQLDITSYLSAPNRVNTCNSHLGTVYRIFVDVADMGSVKKPTALYNLQTHSIDKIVEAFDPKTGQVHEDVKGLPKLQMVINWPIVAGLKRSQECKSFFQWAESFNDYKSGIKEEVLQLEGYHPMIYKTETYDKRVISLSVFSQQEQQFLQDYHRLRQSPELFEPKDIFSSMRNNEAQEETEKILQNFEIVDKKICCPDVNTLQDLIPYVKRLLQLFPQVKESTKRALSSHEATHKFYQLQTRRYLEQINQSPLHFKHDGNSLSEILRRDQHQVILLNISDGDEWTGLIMVHQVLQKNNCLCEGQYIILTLKCLLTVSQLMELNTLMLSVETPFLLLMACENEQLFNDEEEEILRTLFNTIKQKPNIQLFLITQSRDSKITFLEKIGREAFGDGFVTKHKQLTLSDLATSTQEKLLEKSVSFQGSKISLNKLVPANSTLGKFLHLGALLEGKQLAICEPLLTSNKYSGDYYVGRALRHQKTIKQDIFNDKAVKEKHVFLASTEQEFEDLCQQYPNNNVHWLEKDKSGKLVWQQSEGSLEPLRRYIDTDSSHRNSTDDLDKLLEQAEHQRVMLISDTAGMGKSIVLTNLSKQIKQKFPAKWVLRIDLNNHTDALQTLKKGQIHKEKAIDFVSERLLKLKPGLELELFKQCCEKKQNVRIVIMLDGFDEVSPFYKETFIDLLQALRQTAVEQLWVTTRPHLRDELEDKLQQWSYTLEPFSEENQVEFLRKCFFPNGRSTKPDNEKEEEHEVRTKLEICSEELCQAGSDKSGNISGNPLQPRKVEKIFDGENMSFSQLVESVAFLPTNLTLLGFYEGFVTRQYELYLEDRTGNRMRNDAAKIKKQHIFECAKEDHQLLALKMLFDEKQLAQLKTENHFTLSAECLTKIGIAEENCEGNLQFIHCSFADYFVADFLVNQLTCGTNQYQNVQDFLLTNIFLQPSYQMIRHLIDGLLSKSKPSKEILKQCGNRLGEKREYCERTFYQAAYEGNANIIGFCLESLEMGEHRDTICELLLAQDREGQTAWHLAARWGNIKVLEILWDWAVKKLATNVLKDKLLFASSENTAWNVAASTGNTEVLQKIWELPNEELTKEEINNKFSLATDKKGCTLWHMVATKSHLEFLQKIWEWTKENLTREEIKNNLLLATDSMGNTVWHVATERSNRAVMDKLCEWAEENLTKEEIKNELLLATDSMGNTVWHVAVERGNIVALEKLREWAEENLTKGEIKNKLLLATNNDGTTAWHTAACNGNLDVLLKVWEWAEEKLTTEEINSKILLATDNGGMTAWHTAACNGNLDILLKVWKWAEEKLTTEDINNKILLATDNKGMTALHEAACKGKLDTLLKVWEWAEEKLTKEDTIKKLLFATDDIGMTAWHWAVYQRKLDILLQVWKWSEEKLTKEEIINKLLLATDIKGMTPWHTAACNGNLEVLLKVWEWAEKKLTSVEINNKLLLATDNDGMTAWHTAACNGNLDVLLKVWEWAEEKLTTEDINSKLLLATDHDGMTALHGAACEGNLDILLKIWEWAEEKLTTVELINELLLATDNEGMTAWHRAACNGNLDVLLKVWEWAEEKLKTEDINSKLLLATDHDGMTALHGAACEGNLDVLLKIWEWAEEKLKTEDRIIKLLLSKDNDDMTAWHSAACEGKLDILLKVWEWAEEKLTTEEISSKLLLATDNDGMTALHTAACNGNLDVFLKVWEWAEEKLTTEEISSTLLLATDNEVMTALHTAACNGNLDVLLFKVREWAKENLTKEEIKNKLLLNEGLWERPTGKWLQSIST